jgi:hypothetical protein
MFSQLFEKSVGIPVVANTGQIEIACCNVALHLQSRFGNQLPQILFKSYYLPFFTLDRPA